MNQREEELNMKGYVDKKGADSYHFYEEENREVHDAF